MRRVGFFDRTIAATIPLVPRAVTGRISRTYIAGETLESALECVRVLNGIGARATIDLLGEEVDEPDRCRAIAARYEEILAASARDDLAAGVSVKLSAFGQRKDEGLALELAGRVVRAAREAGRFVRLDMEDARTTDSTLRVHDRLREQGFDNVGVVLQACLHRTWDDAAALAERGADVRVVKGIYIESPTISWRHPEAIRRNYVRVLRLLLEKGCRVAAATHDDLLVYESAATAKELAVDPERFEFQMLLGVREELRDDLIAMGHRMRVYVPFGELWYEYSVRRLRENPAIAGHVTRALLGRLFGKGRKRR